MRSFALVAGVGALVLGSPLAAQVVAPNANATTEGTAAQFGVFVNGSASGSTFQTAYAASNFSTVPIGSQITAIGYRLDGGQTTQLNAISYSTFQLQIGQSANAIGSLSNTFADNLGADTVLAINGLSIPGGSFADAPGINPNPFYILTFGTPYIYTGGDLLVTIREAGNATPLSIDAVPAGGGTSTVAFVGDASATSGESGINFFNAPVIQLVFGSASAVPEPSTWTMMLLGFAGIGLAIRRRRAAKTSVLLAG